MRSKTISGHYGSICQVDREDRSEASGVWLHVVGGFFSPLKIRRIAKACIQIADEIDAEKVGAKTLKGLAAEIGAINKNRAAKEASDE